MLPKLIFLPQPAIEMLIAENLFFGDDAEGNENSRDLDSVISLDESKLQRALSLQLNALSTKYRRRLDHSSVISVVFKEDGVKHGIRLNYPRITFREL